MKNTQKTPTYIIVGGAGLIGSAVAEACAKDGAQIVIADIDLKKGHALALNISKKTKNMRVLFRQCDITDTKSVRMLMQYVKKEFGQIDAIVNTSYPRNKHFGRKFEEVTYKDFCQNLDLHAGGYFLTAQEAAKIMKKQGYGNIINFASIYGVSAPKFDIYNGTNITVPIEYAIIKGGIIMMTKYLARYLGPDGIRVNAISPGGVFDNQPKSFVKQYNSRVPLSGRMARTDDITGVISFLLSDAARYTTGQNIVVDGGWTL